MKRKPHPVCGHLKPEFAHRASGPCDWCLADLDREYFPVVVELSWDDIRAIRRPLLDKTDWVETHPERRSRAAPDYITALLTYRQTLFNITEDFETPGDVVFPAEPREADFR